MWLTKAKSAWCSPTVAWWPGGQKGLNCGLFFGDRLKHCIFKEKVEELKNWQN
jgi:hypothetical protein